MLNAPTERYPRTLPARSINNPTHQQSPLKPSPNTIPSSPICHVVNMGPVVQCPGRAGMSRAGGRGVSMAAQRALSLRAGAPCSARLRVTASLQENPFENRSYRDRQISAPMRTASRGGRRPEQPGERRRGGGRGAGTRSGCSLRITRSAALPCPQLAARRTDDDPFQGVGLAVLKDLQKVLQQRGGIAAAGDRR